MAQNNNAAKIELAGLADEIDVELTRAELNGELTHICELGKRYLVFTPTFIFTGIVGAIGPLCTQFFDAEIVFNTGPVDDQLVFRWREARRYGLPVTIPIVSTINVVELNGREAYSDGDYSWDGDDAFRSTHQMMANLRYPYEVGKRYLFYTTTFGWAGTVLRVGPLCAELDPKDTDIVFSTGPIDVQLAGNWEDSAKYGKPVRIGLMSIVAAQELPPTERES